MPGKLQKEIQQSKPFKTLEEEALLNLARTLDRLTQPVEALLKEHGVSRTQYNVLRILRGAGKEGLPCGEVAARMVSRDPDMTRLLDRLERAGHVVRSRETEDRRVISARITGNGLGLLDTIEKPLASVLKQTLGHMTRKDLRTLIALLEQARS